MSDGFEAWRDSAGEPGPESGDGDAWSAHPHAVDHAHRRDARPRLDPHHVAAWLPRLGTTLWMDRRESAATPARCMVGAHGLLRIEDPCLLALARSEQIDARTTVTPLGPREWLDFRDARGRVQARLFLLPDTDYLAWDSMLAGRAKTPAHETAGGWKAHAAFLRGAFERFGTSWRARVVAFRLRRVLFLSMLDAAAPARVSPLGQELARAIAAAEHAEYLPFR
jgi:hypothetical protein